MDVNKAESVLSDDDTRDDRQIASECEWSAHHDTR